jgi:hypothetical protein
VEQTPIQGVLTDLLIYSYDISKSFQRNFKLKIMLICRTKYKLR